MPSVTTGQIHAQVAAIRKRIKNGAQVFAIRTTEAWAGPDHLQIDGTEHLVMPCLSDLQARDALLRAVKEDKPVVLLCTIGSDKLGDDVVARFAKQRIFTPQVRDVLAELFAVRIVDPRVLATQPLIDALMERVPVSGYRPITGGTLDLQQAWSALIEQIVGAAIDEPNLNQMLDWSLEPKRIKALAELNPALKAAFVEWFASRRGEAIRFIMAAVDAGMAVDLIPLGLCLGLAFAPELQKSAEFHAVRARLEKFFSAKAIDPESARIWFRAAEAAVRSLVEKSSNQTVSGLLNRLDVLLMELKVDAFSFVSDYSPTGLAGRFDRLGKAMQKAAKGRTPPELEEVRSCLVQVDRHMLAREEADRLGRAEMALRLIGWLTTNTIPNAAAPLPDLMEYYHRDGGYLDWARNRLRETDVSKPLQAAYRLILEQADALATPFEAEFASKLAAWTKDEKQSDRLICIEDVLAKVVIPVAKIQPVLLLVLDGMSVSVFRQLLRDIERQNWSEITSQALGLPSPVLAALPSITQISRRALFLGKLGPAKSGTEKGEFAGNDFLFHAAGGQVKPQLFLKGDLQDEGGGGLAEDVRAAIADKKCRVVAMVVNAIDDHLDSGDQVVFTWGLDRIRPLREILKLSSDAGRLVLMTSDHGHVLDFGTKLLATDSGEFGDRYRLSTAAINAGEAVFEGSRVAKANGQDRVTLAYSSDVRYGAKKRGYHGGANPQEMIAPLAILGPANAIPAEGWQEVAPYEPDWWRIAKGTDVVAPQAKAEVVEEVKGLELFDRAAKTIPVAPGQSWIEVLFDSPIYQDQQKLAVRGAPPRETVIALIQSVEARGGSIMKPALAQVLGVPLFRVDGLVQNISRILNVDGYDVLSFDRASETISLNVKLLKTQFAIEST